MAQLVQRNSSDQASEHLEMTTASPEPRVTWLWAHDPASGPLLPIPKLASEQNINDTTNKLPVNLDFLTTNTMAANDEEIDNGEFGYKDQSRFEPLYQNPYGDYEMSITHHGLPVIHSTSRFKDSSDLTMYQFDGTVAET